MDAVVTCLLTAEPDPQRGVRLPSDSTPFRTLADSVVRLGHRLTVLADFALDDASVDVARVEGSGNPYFARWRHIAEWLDLTDIDRVWCVDATDVVMLHDPFPHMQPGVIYSGSEPRTLVGDTPEHRWLKRECPSARAFCRRHPLRPFLNPGILGGDRADIQLAAKALSVDTGDLCDMGAWQQIAYAIALEQDIVTGHPVHTEYKAFQLDDPEAWWAHK